MDLTWIQHSPALRSIGPEVGARAVRKDTTTLDIKSLTACQANRIRVRVRIV